MRVVTREMVVGVSPSGISSGVSCTRMHCLSLKEIKTSSDKQTDRQTEKQTDRQSDRQSDKQTDRQTNRQRNRQTDRQTNRQTNRQRNRQTDRRRLGERKDIRQTNKQTSVVLNERQTDRHELRNTVSYTHVDIVSVKSVYYSVMILCGLQ